MFEKVLIADRGEIALRILRACRELGIRTAVVYSTADADSAAVRLADEAVRIGPSASRRSYLNAAAVVEAARKVGAQAVHPGYGFLSEDADFAEICADNGLTFVGPSPQVMAALADKSSARALMRRAGLPLPPGAVQPVPTVGEAALVAAEVGYPVIVKAAAGGGGRGMTVVRVPADLPRAYARTRAAAQAAFGDDRVAVECRVNVEDPDRGFVPTPGRLDRFVPPGGPFTRVDTHGHAGYLVGPHYDSLLAKVAVWAPDRDLALSRLDRALREFEITGPGVRTTIPFVRRVLDDADFCKGRYSTGLVDRMTAGSTPVQQRRNR
ncbi:biotin carboxylase N-terminal domain-containing protein [Micromonospora sp. NPDC003241]